MRYNLQNIALGYYGKPGKEDKNTPIYSTRFFNIDWKAISYSPGNIIIPWFREFVYPFIQALNFNQTNWTFNNDQALLEKLNKIKVVNRLLFKVLGKLAVKKIEWKIEMTKVHFFDRILSIIGEKSFLLEVKQDMIDNVISWIYTLSSKNPWILSVQELGELEEFYNWDKLESIEFPIIDEFYIKNRFYLAEKERKNENLMINEKNEPWSLKKWFWIRNFKAEVWNILLNTDLTWEIETTEKELSFFLSTTPRLSDEALNTILN